MKIVYLILGTFNSGGMERVLSNKANWLVDNAGYDVSVVTTDQREREPFFDFSPKITHYDLGINYTDNTGKSFISKTVSYLDKQKRHKQKLKTLLKELKADVVVSMFGAEIGFLWKINDGSKKVVEIHFSKYFRLQQARAGVWLLVDQWRSMQDKRYIKKYVKFIVLTNEDKSYWGDLTNVEVIYNAMSFIPTQRATLENKRVISVGRLNYQKGYDMLLEVWAKVLAKHIDWKLDIFGGGQELEERQKQARELGISDSVNFMPPTRNIETELLNSSIYALSSRLEGLPMVLLESMSCGLPAVAFACKCGPRDIIEDGSTGILVRQDDIDGLADGICKLIEDVDLRCAMGKKAAESISERFGEEKIMGQWVELFNRLITS